MRGLTFNIVACRDAYDHLWGDDCSEEVLATIQELIRGEEQEAIEEEWDEYPGFEADLDITSRGLLAVYFEKRLL